MSSATDEKIKDGAGATGKNEPKSRRPNPVVLAVPVSVAGARPASGNNQRELFSEETTTVLVFKDGAVIQLSAAITVGQLLFLTDNRSKREVVCQVVHKRNHRPTSCYVELEFTEEAGNFWGVSFLEQEGSTELPPTAEAVEAEETTDDDHSEPIEAPKTEDVAQLKSEVEALRAQLRALQEKQAGNQNKAPDDRDAQAKKLAEAEAAARAAVESSAKENADRMDREARERAARMAEKARQTLQAQSAPVPPEANKRVEADFNAPVKSEVDFDATAKAAAEAEAAARSAAEAEAAARTATEEAARQSSWATDEESRKASDEARKWELDSIEAERRRKSEDQERRERAERGEPEPEPATEPEKQVPAGGLKIGMKLPSGASSAPPEAAKAVTVPAASAASKESVDPIDELLPKPALDFTKAPKGLDPNDPYNIYRPMRKKAGWLEMVLALVLVVLLVGGGGYAWYVNKLPFFHRGPKLAAAAPTLAKPTVTAKPAPAAATPNGAVPANGAGGLAAAGAQPAGDATANTVVNSAGGAAPPISVAPEVNAAAKNDASAEPAAEPKARERFSSEGKAPTRKGSSQKTAGTKKGNNLGRTSSESKPKLEEAAVASDAPVIPAKLVHAVQPVYPPDAMRGYITGDVRLEATVDAKGHVGAMNVLVGPAPLRQAAMEALKQYEYEPATQGGMAVASKVTVTIKFWFDP